MSRLRVFLSLGKCLVEPQVSWYLEIPMASEDSIRLVKILNNTFFSNVKWLCIQFHISNQNLTGTYICNDYIYIYTRYIFFFLQVHDNNGDRLWLMQIRQFSDNQHAESTPTKDLPQYIKFYSSQWFQRRLQIRHAINSSGYFASCAKIRSDLVNLA